MTITVTQVGGRNELREFCELPLRIHPRDRYVPTLEPQIRRGTGNDRRAPRRPRPAGTPVGRICLHRYPQFDSRIGKRAQLFGLTEFADPQNVGEDVAKELFDLTGRAGADTDALFGPVGLLPNQSGGVITSGFEERGFIDSAWNPAVLPGRVRTARLHPAGSSADTWICELDVPAPSTPARRSCSTTAASPASGCESGTARAAKLRDATAPAAGMLNASFAQLGYYTEISAAELAAQTDGLAYLLDEGCC